MADISDKFGFWSKEMKFAYIFPAYYRSKISVPNFLLLFFFLQISRQSRFQDGRFGGANFLENGFSVGSMEVGALFFCIFAAISSAIAGATENATRERPYVGVEIQFRGNSSWNGTVADSAANVSKSDPSRTSNLIQKGPVDRAPGEIQNKTDENRKWVPELFDEAKRNFEMGAEVNADCRRDFEKYKMHLSNQSVWAIRSKIYISNESKIWRSWCRTWEKFWNLRKRVRPLHQKFCTPLGSYFKIRSQLFQNSFGWSKSWSWEHETERIFSSFPPEKIMEVQG